MRLWVRLAAVIATVAIALVAASGYAAMQVASDKATNSARRILERDAVGLSLMIGAWVDDQRDALAGWSEPFQATTPQLQERLQEAVYLAVPSVVTVTVVDLEDGQPVLPPLFTDRIASPTSPLYGRVPGSPARAVALVARLPTSEVEHGGAAVGEPFLPPGDSIPSVPIVAHRAESGFILGAEISLEPIAALLERQQSPEHGVALVDSAGDVVLGGALVDATALAPLLGAEVPSFTQFLSDGSQVTGSIAPVRSTGWSVVVTEPVEVATRAASDIRRWTLQLIAASVLLALLAATILARSLSGRVGRLRDSALAVAEGDLSHRVYDLTRDEVGDLSRAFNHMAARLDQNARELQAQRDEIAAFNEELQERVRERTRELEVAQDQLVRSGQLAAVAHLGAGLAHELNNPLTSVLGLAQVLRVRIPEGATRDLVGQLEGEARRCRSVVDAMLRFGSDDVDPTDASVVDMRVVLRDVAELVRGPFRQRSVELEVVTPNEPVRVRIPPLYASRVLVQVLDSVRAGLTAGGSLQVGVQRSPEGDAVILLRPTPPVAMSDDWMASGMTLWVAREMLHRVGGRLDEPDGEGRWSLVFPRSRDA